MAEVFLISLIEQSQKTQDKVIEINTLYNNLKEKIISVNSVYATKLLDIIFTTPIVSFIHIKKRIDVKSNQTIYNLLEKFMKIGILKEVGIKKRNRTFVFSQLLQVLKNE